jgi:hypothetical protein
MARSAILGPMSADVIDRAVQYLWFGQRLHRVFSQPNVLKRA